MDKKLDSKKLLMLLLYLPLSSNGEKNEPIKGSTRLQKMMFIYEKEIHNKYNANRLINFEPDFFAFNYGPFSSKVFDDVKFLINSGFIQEKNLNTSSDVEDYEFNEYEADEYGDDLKIIKSRINDQNYIEYSLSEKGIKFTEEKVYKLIEKNDTLLSVLINFKSKIVNMPLMSIIKYVYTKYPELTENSKIKDMVM